MTELDELNIPKATRPVAEEIIGITDEVCAKLLDAEYASLARQVVAKLARKRPSPLLGSRRVTWAAAVVYALGQVNFLFDSSRELHRTADELSAAFGVADTETGSRWARGSEPWPGRWRGCKLTLIVRREGRCQVGGGSGAGESGLAVRRRVLRQPPGG